MGTSPPTTSRRARSRSLSPVPYRVAERRRETGDTWTLEIEPAGAGRLEDFAPGQFAMLYAFGAGEAPISVCAYDAASGRVTHTIRAVGAVSAALCAARPGHEIGVRGPYGTSWPLREAEGRDVVLVAGGLGMAPLRPALEQLLAARARYGAVCLLYGGRSPAELVLRREIERWTADGRADVQLTVDGAGSGWRGSVGVVTALIPRAAFDAATAVAMVVGPELMMRFTVAALRERGMAPGRIHVSLERSMHCAIGHCGHCMIGPEFVCKDGPVFPWSRVEPWLGVRAL